MDPIHRLLAPFCALAFLGLAARAESPVASAGGPKVQTSLIAERPSITPGGTVTVALRERIRKDWHTYWRNPGDSGQPTSITWQLPAGWKAGAIEWPYPKRVPVGPLMNFAYEDEVMLLVPVTAPANARVGDIVMLKAHALWLVCKEVCIPEEADLSLPLTVGATPAPADSRMAAAFAATRAKLPHPSPWPARFAAGEKNLSLLLAAPELGKARPRDAFFFPYMDGYVQPASPQKIEATSEGLVLSGIAGGWRLDSAAKRAAVNRIDGIVVVTGADGRTEAIEIAATPGYVPGAAPDESEVGLLRALLFALLGGLILNLMPCVFPILSMKALALARKAGSTHATHGESLAYGFGVVVTFAALAGVLLALRAGGAAIGWGFQLQEPIVVAGLALLMLAVGLNLAGVFELGGGRLAGIGQKFASKGGVVGSFFTGALAVAVATPCTAPFMGAALGFALTADATTAIAVFVMLGIGFALPFIALGYIPALLRLLPRPGPWMNTFRQFLAFPMLGAAAWLLWILEHQIGSNGLIIGLAAALALSFALWTYGRSQNASATGRIVWTIVGVLSLAGAIWLVTAIDDVAPSNTPQANVAGVIPYEPYSEKRLAELRDAGRPVFVNATADWCITCLLNERVALENETVANAFAAHKVVALKADWTRRDAAVAALLAQYGRQGVPLYLYFAPGAREPTVLPQILTGETILSVLGSQR